jgi:hypothetical protein
MADERTNVIVMQPDEELGLGTSGDKPRAPPCVFSEELASLRHPLRPHVVINFDEAVSRGRIVRYIQNAALVVFTIIIATGLVWNHVAD